MENSIQLNEINEVDLSDETLTTDLTPGSGVAASIECTLVKPVVVESKFGDGDGAGSGAMSMSGAGAGIVAGARARVGAGGEGGSAAFQKKERQKI
jgi:hypothetical protein